MNRFFKKHWPLVGVVSLLGLAGFFLVRGGGSIIDGLALEEIFTGEGVQLKDIHFTQDGGRSGMKWILDAAKVHLSGDQKTVSFKDFRLRVEPRGRPWIRLKGKQGAYSRDTGEIRLSGDLVGVTQDGYRIFTDQVLIHERRKRIETDGPVRILGPFFSVEGRGLFVDLEAEIVRVLSDVTTIVSSNRVEL